MAQAYEMVIGLEVHVELKTESKIFCGCSTAFGAPPNTQCCPVCMGMPGTLPVLNEKVVDFAVKAGLATNCEIASFSKQDRKNYFYPDLPKAYQISQYDLPLCLGGVMDILVDGKQRRVGITRIHIEEDAGKLVHSADGGTYCDYNRCGVPLIEIVTEPDLRSAEEVTVFLRKLRAILQYIDVSDCKMEEGSMRCDVNLSVRKPGEEYGTRTEMKNLNSFQYIGKAIAYEYARQVAALETGEEIVQETRRYDQQTDKTYSMRGKEEADDYRYFPDPDLVPIVLSNEKVQNLKGEIPQLPDERKGTYVGEYGIALADADVLVQNMRIAEYFEQAAAHTTAYQMLSNLMLGEVFRLLEGGDKIPIQPEYLGEVATLLEGKRINPATARSLVAQMWEGDRPPSTLAEEQQLWQIGDEDTLLPIVEQVVEENPKAIADYKSGKKKALQVVVGKVMQATKGRGDAAVILALLYKLLEN